jgi:hypothetical protein
MSKWWEENMSDAGQGLYADPSTAVQVATIPASLLATQELQKRQVAADAQQERNSRNGFMTNIMNGITSFGKGVDGALSNIPGYGVTKQVVWWPVDKVATGMHWVYSEALSQPLSTAFLVSGKAETEGYGQFLSGSAWSEAYGQAENISPGQAYMNASATDAATGNGVSVPALIDTGLSQQEKDQAKTQQDRFLYDTDYWRSKAGWKYTVGTGAIDFGLVTMADPGYAALKYGAQAVKSARSIKLAGEGAELATKGIVAGGKTAEDVSTSSRLNTFFDWAEGKSPAAIRAHSIWGVGRRANPFASQYSEVLAHASREDMPNIVRFAMGDADALPKLNESNQSLVSMLGDMNDNRTFLQSVKFSDDIIKYFQKEAEGATLEGVTKKGKVVVPPTPRPSVGAAAQQAWDAAWGKTAQKADIYRQAVSEYGALKSAAIKAGSVVDTTPYKFAKNWKAAQLESAGRQVADLQAKDASFSLLLGANGGRSVDEFLPGESNLFGTLKTLYRMGPLALKDTEKSADIAYMKQALDRSGRKAIGGNLASRFIRNGYYAMPLRVIQSFGDRAPQGFINHNEVDAVDRVVDMLKQVPGLGEDARMGMIDAYSKAPTKLEKSKALDTIHSAVIGHMAGRYGNLDDDSVRLLDEMRKSGFQTVMAGLTGGRTDQMFSATKAVTTMSRTGTRRVDLVEDGKALVPTPLAKTQLGMAEPLLPVKEFERFLSRSNGYFAAQKKGALKAADGLMAVADLLNTSWKATTLLRPGYVLRAPSEEIALRAVKFGVLATIADAGAGGVNFLRNRTQHVAALLGTGSHTGITGKSIVNLEDRNAIQVAQKLGQKAERIRVNRAWPIVQGRIKAEASDLDETTRELASIQKKLDKYRIKYGSAGVAVNKKGKFYTDEIARLRQKAADHQDVIDEHSTYANAILAAAKDATGKRLGESDYTYKGIKLHGAFSKDWEYSIPRSQVTSDAAAATLFARGEAIDTARAIKTGSWTGIKPSDPSHMEDWLHVLNHQFGQDRLFRIVAEDPSLTNAMKWMRTAEGKDHVRALGRLGHDPDDLIQAVKIALDDYLPEGTGLQAKIAKGEDISENEIRAAISKDDFPVVHGEETKPLTKMFSKQSATRYLDDLVAKGYKRLGTIPGDVMSRQPIYMRAQQARMRELVDQELAHYAKVGKDTGKIDVGTLNKMQQKSHQMAMKDISQIAYDPARTTATEALRFIAPFLGAHIDGLQRWGGMIAEKPELVNSASKIYNAPVAANLITDTDGNHVGMDGYATVVGVDGKASKQFVPIENRVFNLQVPGDAKNKSVLNVLPGYGSKIRISAMNTILPGDPWFNPGGGPVVQISGSYLANKSPQVGDFLQWAKVLPYGPTGTIDAITPKYMRQIYEAATTDDADNVEYQKAYLATYQKYVAESKNGGPPVDIKQVESDAKSFMWLKMLTSWASPAQTNSTPLTGTPYQFYVDQYKKLQEADPKAAQDQFLKTYGSDYFVFTAALSKSIGIAPTREAMLAADEYKDLIAQDPDMAGYLTMGKQKGKFSSSVYAKQMNESIGGKKIRETQSAMDAVRENQKDLGWQQYNKIKLVLDGVLLRSGYKSYTSSGAEGLLSVKRMAIQQLSQKFPEWEKDFNTTDSGAVSRRINQFTQLVNTDKLANDPLRTDVPVMKAYLARRAIYKQLLESTGNVGGFAVDERGVPTGDNAAIGLAWQQEQTRFINSDTQFNEVFNRYLSNDTLQ